MDDGWPQPAQAGNMFIGAIAFVCCQTIAGVKLIEFYHQVVASYLGDDGSAGDGEAQAIAV